MWEEERRVVEKVLNCKKEIMCAIFLNSDCKLHIVYVLIKFNILLTKCYRSLKVAEENIKYLLIDLLQPACTILCVRMNVFLAVFVN